MRAEQLVTLYQSPEMVQRKYAGQLESEFQQLLEEAYTGISSKECTFYHSFAEGDRLHDGFWDLRGRESDYLGRTDLDACRVLEFGPASGYLTFQMERQGARVVSFELPPGRPPDLVPLHSADLDAHRRLAVQFMDGIRNSWWYLRKTMGGSAAVVYGDIYDLPPDLGHFDVATFGCILLHLSNPFRALQAASLLTDAIIVTDVLQGLSYLPGRALLEFHPDMRPDLTNWWALTPVGVERMLHVLGFLHTECWFHFQRRKDSDRWVETPLFTVVGRRSEGKPPRPQIGLQEQERQKELAAAWEQRTERELLDTRAALVAMRQSSSWRLTRGLRLVADYLKGRKGD